jgi:hypothetical protein
MDQNSTLALEPGYISGLHIHTLTQHNTSTPLPELERHYFTPKRVLLCCLLRVDQTPLLLPKADLNLNPGSYQTDERGSQFCS